MAYLDYSPVQIADQSEGIRRFGDSLTEIMKVRAQRKQHEEQMKFQREQENRKFAQAQMNTDYQNRIIDQREKRDQITFGRQMDADNAVAMEKARKAASPQEAEAILSNVKRYDTKTGDVLGTGTLTPGPLQNVGEAPTALPRPDVPPEIGAALPDILKSVPGMPPEIAARMRGKKRPEPDAGAMIGPIPSAEEARNAEEERQTFEAGPDTDVQARLAEVERERQAQEAQRGRYESDFQSFNAAGDTIDPALAANERYGREFQAYSEDQATLPGRQAAHAADVKRAEASRPYTMSLPGQPDVTFDFQTQRFAARNDAADRFLASLPPGMTDDDKQAAAQIHAGIKSGTIDPNKAGAMFQRERIGAAEREFKDVQGDKRDAAALERAKIPKPGLTLQTQRFGFDERKERSKILRTDLADWTKKFDAKTIQDDHLAAPRIITDLQSGNPQRQRNAMIELWRMAQHDNRMSDKDAVMAQTVDPSWVAQVGNWVSRGAEGVLADDVRDTAIATAKGFSKALGDKKAAMKANAKAEFIDSGLYDVHEADVLLGQKLPGWERLTDNPASAGSGGPPEVNARRKGKANQKTKIKANSVDDALRLLEGVQ